MKQTAVEWLFEQVMVTHPDNLDKLLEQAKEMEKQEKIDAYTVGQGENPIFPNQEAEKYYNETFKSE